MQDPKIYRDLDGVAMLMPIPMGINMAIGNRQKHLSLGFATNREFVSRGTKKL